MSMIYLEGTGFDILDTLTREEKEEIRGQKEVKITIEEVMCPNCDTLFKIGRENGD